jgi:O-antigen/teichoic acid export membrane protein
VAFRVILLGLIFGSVAKINNSILTSIGKPKVVTRIITSTAVVNLILNLVLIPKFGINGAATATFFSYITMFILSLKNLTSRIRYKAPWKDWVLTFIGGLIFLSSISFLKNIIALVPLIEAAIVVIVSGFIYIAWLFIVKVLTIKEIRNIIKQVL